MGCDMIPVKLIRMATPYIVQPLTSIINSSLHTGIVPNMLKKARIVAIHKGGSKELCNYRPISILPILSKVFRENGLQSNL